MAKFLSQYWAKICSLKFVFFINFYFLKNTVYFVQLILEFKKHQFFVKVLKNT